MTTVVFIRALMDAGLSAADALKAAEVYETMQPVRSKGAERMRRWRERHAASQSVTCDARDVCDAVPVTEPTPSLSPSPQTPQPHTHPRVGTTRAREGAAAPSPERSPIVGQDWPDGDCRRHAELLAIETNTARLDPSKTEGLLLTSARLAAWRAAGASWEFDVIPTVTALASRAGRKITSWKFFDDAIAQSIADNRAALTIPEATRESPAHVRRHDARFDAKVINLDRHLAGAEQAADLMASRRAL